MLSEYYVLIEALLIYKLHICAFYNDSMFSNVSHNASIDFVETTAAFADQVVDAGNGIFPDGVFELACVASLCYVVVSVLMYVTGLVFSLMRAIEPCRTRAIEQCHMPPPASERELAWKEYRAAERALAAANVANDPAKVRVCSLRVFRARTCWEASRT
jgi:hypothetical protein